MTEIVTTDGRTIRRVSRWIKIQQNYRPNKRNRLFYYATDSNGYREGQSRYNPAEGLYLDYFRWNGRTWALEQFLRMDYPMMYENEDGKLSYLSGYDSEDYYHPILIELDDCGEYVRVYVEV